MNNDNLFSCTLLNITGDVTIAWDNSTSDDVKKWVKEKIDEGYTFFIVETKFKLFKKKKKVSNVDDLPSDNAHVVMTDKQAKELFSNNMPNIDKALPSNEKVIDNHDTYFYSSIEKMSNQNKIRLGDESAEELVKKGKVIPFRAIQEKTKTVKKISRDPEEIVKSHTIVSRRMMGG